MKSLGIETSCDETSVAILDDGQILANRTYTQEIHSRYGGVVPEVASRAHLAKLQPLCESVFDSCAIDTANIDLIAVTDGPGLAGALLVGTSFALGLHVSRAIPVTGIHHLEGHICSAMFAESGPPPYPFLALVVSGGHTAIYLVEDFGEYRCLGRTVDDAAGEAFDKVGKMVGFPYPAGRAIEEEAAKAGSENGIGFPVARLDTPGFDFSFSGLKTAVRYHIESKEPTYLEKHRPGICRAFQDAVIEALVSTAQAASAKTGIQRIAVVGGVACNRRLRAAMNQRLGSATVFPAPRLCTDNAAMIARAGYERAVRGMLRPPHMNPAARL